MVAKYALGLGALLLAGLVGCTQQKLADDIPPPRFAGPTIVRAAPPVSPSHVAPALPPKTALAPGVAREWVPYAPARPWRWIIIHHSATPSGSAAKFDRDHRSKGWDELGYHFVVGNGSETRLGQI